MTDNQPCKSDAAPAEQIALEASKLARIANANDFSMLAYLLDMVVLEAWREATEPAAEPEPPRVARLRAAD